MNTDKNKNTDDMKKALTFIFCCILAVSCGSADRENRVTGTVIDASMNTVVIRSGSDTLSFSTLNADRSGLDGLLVGDTVEIFYKGENRPGTEASRIKSADRETVSGHDETEENAE